MKSYFQGSNGIRILCAIVVCAAFMAGIVDPATAAMGAAAPFVVGDTSIEQLKVLIQQQGEAFEQFKKANDALLKAKAEGKAIGDLEAKVAKIGEDLDRLADMKTEMEALAAKIAEQPAPGTAEAKQLLVEEAKTFNLHLAAHRQAKGLPAVAFEVDAFAQYKSAFLKVVRTGSLESLSAEERKAMIAGADADGGFLLPPATVGAMAKRLYEQSIMRQLALVQPIGGPALEGIIDINEADAGWVGETAARPETNTPQVGKYKLEAFEMYAAPKSSQQLLDDAAVDVEAWLAGKVADKFGRVEGAAFWTGNGVGKPRGLCDYPTAATADATRAWGTFEHVKSGANGAFHTDKFDAIHNLMGTIKDHFLPNATFVMRRSVRTAARKIKEATTDRYMWEPGLQAGQPERLMGYPVRIDEYMPALATDSLSLAFGDFRQAYTIVDRIGVRTLRDPYTAKPYVIFYSTKRTGGGAVNFEAVKFLKFSA